MGNELKEGRVRVYSIFAVLIIVVISRGIVWRASGFVEKNRDPSCYVCNISNCIQEDVDESDLFIESDVNRRSLQSTVKGISYGALERQPACDANRYGNCIVQTGGYNPPCSYYNRCKRSPR